MKSIVSVSSTAIALVAVAAGAVGLTIAHAAAPAPANMKTFMIDVVGPAVKPIWDLSYADKISDAEWGQVQKASADLLASMTTISSGGRIPAEQARAKDPMWQDWAKKNLADARAAKAAADKKDQMALATAGDSLVETCGGCHTVFDPGAR